jgi:hypothetical protein
MGMAFHAKPGIEIDSFHIDTLLLDYPDCQHGVKTTGYESHRFFLLGFRHTVQ